MKTRREFVPVPRGPHVNDHERYNYARMRQDYEHQNLRGAGEPRLFYNPPADSWDEGEEACEFARQKGFPLDPWQEWDLKNAMATVGGQGRWAAFEHGLIISRQNGKNAIAEVRELAGLYLLREPLIIHTAHEFKASVEQFRRLRAKIEDDDWMRKRIKSITTSHGDEAIELLPEPTLIIGPGSKLVKQKVAPRLRFLARSGGSGRSFTCHLLVWDEAMILTKEQVGAALPTLSAVANPQVWYMGSAGNELSVQLAQIRARGVKGDALRRAGKPYLDETGEPVSLSFTEYSIDHCHEYCRPTCPEHADTTMCGYHCVQRCTDHDDPEDPVSWARANPGLGTRISIQHIRREMASMAPNGVVVSPADVFARERLGVGRWPADENGWAVISQASWEAIADPDSPRAKAPFAIAADVSPDQSQAAIAIVGRRPDRKIVAEIAEGHHRAGTNWVVGELVRLQKLLSSYGMSEKGRAESRRVSMKRRAIAQLLDDPALHPLRREKLLAELDQLSIPSTAPCAVVIDKSGPAGVLLNDAQNAGLEVTCPNTNEAAQAFELFYTAVNERTLVHLGEEWQPDLHAAVAGAARREVGDSGFAWARRDSAVDITPLVACTLGVWGLSKFGAKRYDVVRSVSPAHDWSTREQTFVPVFEQW